MNFDCRIGVRFNGDATALFLVIGEPKNRMPDKLYDMRDSEPVGPVGNEPSPLLFLRIGLLPLQGVAGWYLSVKTGRLQVGLGPEVCGKCCSTAEMLRLKISY